MDDAPVGSVAVAVEDDGELPLLDRIVLAGDGSANSAFVGGDRTVVPLTYVDTRVAVSEHVYVQLAVSAPTFAAAYPSQHVTDALQFWTYEHP